MKKKANLRWQEGLTAADNARLTLPELARQFFAMGRETAHPQATPEQLHALRLAGKRLRYTLELFEGCYGHGLSRRLKSLKTIQDYLGEINDCATAQLVLAPWSPEPKLLAFLEERTARLKEEFIEHWRADFDKPGAERLWVSYLKRPPRQRNVVAAEQADPPAESLPAAEDAPRLPTGA